MNYEINSSDDTIGNVSVHCHESDILNFFRKSKKLDITDGGYARVTFPELITLKENTSIKILHDTEGQLLVSKCGNTVPSDKPCHQLSGIVFNGRSKQDWRTPLPIS